MSRRFCLLQPIFGHWNYRWSIAGSQIRYYHLFYSFYCVILSSLTDYKFFYYITYFLFLPHTCTYIVNFCKIKVRVIPGIVAYKTFVSMYLLLLLKLLLNERYSINGQMIPSVICSHELFTTALWWFDRIEYIVEIRLNIIYWWYH